MTPKFKSGQAPEMPQAGTEQSKQSNQKAPGFVDKFLKPEYSVLKLKLQTGQTWVRFLPPLEGSTCGSFAAIVGMTSIEAQHPFPAMRIQRTPRDLIGRADYWLYKTHPDYKRKRETNPNGISLRESRYGVAWCVNAKAEEGSRLRLMMASAGDGSYGGKPGLFTRIFDTLQNKDESGAPMYPDITAQEAGRQVCITGTQATTPKDRSYDIQIGTQPAPLDKILPLLSQAELALICPLENVFVTPTEDEQKEFIKAGFATIKGLYEEFEATLTSGNPF